MKTNYFFRQYPHQTLKPILFSVWLSQTSLPTALSVSYLISGCNGGVVEATGAVGWSRMKKGDLGHKAPALSFASVGEHVHSFSSCDALSNQDAGQADSNLFFVLIK